MSDNTQVLKKLGFAVLNPLDHGVLNIPNRTKNIDRDLDTYKTEQAKIKKAKLAEIKHQNTKKLEAEKQRLEPIKQKAWDLYKKHSRDMIKKHGAMLPFRLGDGYNNNLNPRDFLRDTAKYQPERFLDILNWHLAGGEIKD